MLDKLKLLLGINANDATRDELLNLMLDMAQNRLLLIIGEEILPASLGHIVVDVALARYNRIGSEGLTSHTVEGETQTFTDDDFASYDDDIQAYMVSKGGDTPGRVRFI